MHIFWSSFTSHHTMSHVEAIAKHLFQRECIYKICHLAHQLFRQLAELKITNHNSPATKLDD